GVAEDPDDAEHKECDEHNHHDIFSRGSSTTVQSKSFQHKLWTVTGFKRFLVLCPIFELLAKFVHFVLLLDCLKRHESGPDELRSLFLPKSHTNPHLGLCVLLEPRETYRKATHLKRSEFRDLLVHVDACGFFIITNQISAIGLRGTFLFLR